MCWMEKFSFISLTENHLVLFYKPPLYKKERKLKMFKSLAFIPYSSFCNKSISSNVH